ncbi:MAG: SDR family NAD(P)-dependent oxidoreductase [Bacilli bacterium]
MKKYTKWVYKHCKDLKDKNIILTGANSGIGFYISYYLVALHANLIMAVRNIEKGQEAKEAILKDFPNANILILEVNISNNDSIKEFSKSFKDKHIDFLINNAGIYHLPRQYNKDKIELTFATNTIGPVLLTKTLKRYVRDDFRVINCASISYSFKKEDLDDLYSLKLKNKTSIYARSKRYLMIESLYEKQNETSLNICHPGVTASNLFDASKGGFSKSFNKLIKPLMRLVFISPSKAALNAVYATSIDTKYGYMIGPKGFLHIYGYPGVQKIKKDMLDSKTQKEVNNSIDGLI